MKLNKNLLFLLGFWFGLGLNPSPAHAMDPNLLEEPGFSFYVNNPYTEPKQFMQVESSLFFINYAATPNSARQRDFVSTLDISYGFTDRLEADLALQFNNQWLDPAVPYGSAHGFSDTVLGLRYRFLTEKDNPITLSFGPQLLLPTGNLAKGFGTGGLSLAWDFTLGKEWNRYFFNYFNWNYALTFSALDPDPNSFDHHTLQDFFWGICLGFRPYEKDTESGGHKDVHLTLEFTMNTGQNVQPRKAQGMLPFIETVNTFVLIPGFKYGYVTKKNLTSEVGLGAIIGFGNNSPDWGIALQTQFEFSVKKQ